jgi:hypothetical protein
MVYAYTRKLTGAGVRLSDSNLRTMERMNLFLELRFERIRR